MDYDAVAADVAATYQETLRRLGLDLPAFGAALKVYQGHRPNDPDAQATVAKIIAIASRQAPGRG